MTPWLSDVEINAAIEYGRLAANQAHQPHPPEQSRVGARAALALGSGLDYADTRPMTAGDSLRHINWRATARHGNNRTPLVQVYHPELNTATVMVLDSRESLWFASRGRLKWAQALRSALSVCAYRATHGDEIGLFLVSNNNHRWLPVQPGAGIQSVLCALASESRSLPSQNSATVPLWNVIDEPVRQLSPATSLLFISDQSGLFSNFESSIATARSLARRFALRVCELIDPLDEVLPEAGDLTLCSEPKRSFWRSSADSERRLFARQQQRVLSEARDAFIASGLQWQLVSTTDEDLLV